MNVLQHTRDELNLCRKQNRPDRSYRDTLLRVQTSTCIWNVTNFRTYQRNIRYIMNKETLAKKRLDWGIWQLYTAWPTCFISCRSLGSPYVWLKIDTVYKLSKFCLSFVCFSLELPEKNSRHITICTNKQSFLVCMILFTSEARSERRDWTNPKTRQER